MNKNINFIHIPKTAGTSLRGFIENLYNVNLVNHSWLVDDLLKTPPWRLSNLKVISGHFPVSVHSMIPNRNAINLTFLRNPVSRAISHFNYLRKTPSAFMHSVAAKNSFSDFLQRADGLFELTNFQTRYLGGDNLNNDYFIDFSQTDQIECFVDEWTSGEKIERAFERACQYLQVCDIVGIVERMPESIRLLSHKLELPSQIDLGFSNKGQSHVAISHEELSILKKINFYDILLYEKANEILSSRLSKLSPKLLDSNYNKHFSSLEKLTHWYYTPQMGAYAYHWHGREHVGNDEYALWSSSTISFIDIPIDIKYEYIIKFRIGFYSKERMDSFTFLVNQQKLPVNFMRCDSSSDTQGIYYGNITSDYLGKNPYYTRLSWQVDRLTNPSTELGENDNRDLGVYLWWCSVERICPSTPQKNKDKKSFADFFRLVR